MEVGSGSQLCDRSGVDARMLANVERLQVQAVGTGLQNQRVDEQSGKPAAAIFFQARAQGCEISKKLCGACVWRQRTFRLRRSLLCGGRRLRAAAEPDHDASDKQPGKLMREAIDEAEIRAVGAGGAQRLQICVELRVQLI